jgi:hypothetical protein
MPSTHSLAHDDELGGEQTQQRKPQRGMHGGGEDDGQHDSGDKQLLSAPTSPVLGYASGNHSPLMGLSPHLRDLSGSTGVRGRRLHSPSTSGSLPASVFSPDRSSRTAHSSSDTSTVALHSSRHVSPASHYRGLASSQFDDAHPHLASSSAHAVSASSLPPSVPFEGLSVSPASDFRTLVGSPGGFHSRRSSRASSSPFASNLLRRWTHAPAAEQTHDDTTAAVPAEGLPPIHEGAPIYRPELL